MAWKLEFDATEAGLTDLHVEEAALQHEFSKPWKNSDVVLVVEGQNLHVHRIILEMASPVFQKMFSERPDETHGNEMCLPDKNFNKFVEFLRQIYPQFPSTITFDNLGYIHALAEEFQVEKVLATCKACLSSHQLTLKNVSTIVLLAQECKVDEVRQKCCQELRKMTVKDLEKVVSLEDLDAQSLRSILAPKARRLEECLQQLIPKLFSIIDKALDLIKQNSKNTSQPMLCPEHHGVSHSKSVISRDCMKVKERLECKACLKIVTSLHANRCGYDHRWGCYNPEASIVNVFKEMFELVTSQAALRNE